MDKQTTKVQIKLNYTFLVLIENWPEFLDSNNYLILKFLVNFSPKILQSFWLVIIINLKNYWSW